MATEVNKAPGAGPSYFVEVDGIEFRFDTQLVTATQIMEAAGIPISVGLIEILADGTQRNVSPEETFDLEPGRRLKKRPRFKRG